MEAGQIYVDQQFYRDANGELLPKYFVVLAIDSSGDVIARLLTSRKSGRPEDPPCYHGAPYPAFYFGVLSASLPKPSWLDLRALEEFDIKRVTQRMKSGVIQYIHTLQGKHLQDALACAAAADDTTLRQEKAIRDQLAILKN